MKTVPVGVCAIEPSLPRAVPLILPREHSKTNILCVKYPLVESALLPRLLLAKVLGDLVVLADHRPIRRPDLRVELALGHLLGLHLLEQLLSLLEQGLILLNTAGLERFLERQLPGLGILLVALQDDVRL